mmetsp:Transcript_49350/g.128058  ORF Transcript_49350/g.128058 Transcript_49350/m.128058 type:complete len:201 (-) Transcript_49350:8-610(-)
MGSASRGRSRDTWRRRRAALRSSPPTSTSWPPWSRSCPRSATGTPRRRWMPPVASSRSSTPSRRAPRTRATAPTSPSSPASPRAWWPRRGGAPGSSRPTAASAARRRGRAGGRRAPRTRCPACSPRGTRTSSRGGPLRRCLHCGRSWRSPPRLRGSCPRAAPRAGRSAAPVCTAVAASAEGKPAPPCPSSALTRPGLLGA